MLLPLTVQPKAFDGLSNTSDPIVRLLSRVTNSAPVSPAVAKEAVLFAPLATTPDCQLAALLQLLMPLVAVIQFPFCAIADDAWSRDNGQSTQPYDPAGEVADHEWPSRRDQAASFRGQMGSVDSMPIVKVENQPNRPGARCQTPTWRGQRIKWCTAVFGWEIKLPRSSARFTGLVPRSGYSARHLWRVMVAAEPISPRTPVKRVFQMRSHTLPAMNGGPNTRCAGQAR